MLTGSVTTNFLPSGLRSHKKFVGADIAMSNIGSHRSRRVNKHTVTAVAEEKRHGFVHIGTFRPLRVSDKEIEFLPGFIKRCG